MSLVKTLLSASIPTFVVMCTLAGSMFAGDTASSPPPRYQEQEVTVFVTGSLIPQRVKLRRIGTNTVSPVRIIDRNEIDQAGRYTTPGALIDEPSVRVIGH